MRSTVVRRILVDSSKHNALWHLGDGNGAQPQKRPEFLGVYLPPTTPDENWICGTRYVWQVTEESLQEHKPGFVIPDGHQVFVCEHMIELD